jgi:hypothetical protein
VLKTKLDSNQIERDADGTSCRQWLSTHTRHRMGKSNPAGMDAESTKPQGSGAPIGSKPSGEIPPGIKNPFAKETFNLTEQSRLFRTDRDLYDRLKAAAKI